MEAARQIREAARDPARLRREIGDADIVPLLLSLTQLTGDDRLLKLARPYVYGGWSYTQTIPKHLAAEIRERLATEIESAAAALAIGGRAVPEEPDPALLPAMLELAAGETVGPDYHPVFRDEANFGPDDPRDVNWRGTPPKAREDFLAVIVGGGFSGVCMAIKLKRAGIPFVILEKNAQLGGTWLENRYPGIGVDTPCHFFSYAFEFNTDWSSYFASGPEILAYLQRCAEKHGLLEHVRFRESLDAAEWNVATNRWILRTRRADGSADRIEANALITAVGALNRPKIPAIPGLADFEGPAFHTAQWREDVDFSGLRVAMIGTGASGMQTGPSIAPIVENLTIYQRSPHWAVLNPLYHANVGASVRWAMRNIPYYASWFRFQLFYAASEQFHHTLTMDPDWHDPQHSLNAANARTREDLIAYIRGQLGDRTDLLDKVVPPYPPFGKRMLRDNNWYKMLKRPNVELVTGPVERVTPTGVVSGGEERPADAIILATGFQASKMLAPMEIRGRDGKTLRELWGDEDPRAHLGVTHPGFPNFFMIYGPNTNLAHGGSAIFHSECQVRHVMLALREVLEGGHAAIEVRREPFEAYNARLDAVMSRMVWSHPGVGNWYKNSKGRVVMNSPWRLGDYRDMTATLNPADFAFTDAPATADA